MQTQISWKDICASREFAESFFISRIGELEVARQRASDYGDYSQARLITSTIEANSELLEYLLINVFNTGLRNHRKNTLH